MNRLLGWTRQESARPGAAQTAVPAGDPALVIASCSPGAKVAAYAGLFRAHPDAYATRWENPHTGACGWVPAVKGGRFRGVPAHAREYLPLTGRVIDAHLRVRFISGCTHCWMGIARAGWPPTSTGSRRCWTRWRT